MSVTDLHQASREWMTEAKQAVTDLQKFGSRDSVRFNGVLFFFFNAFSRTNMTSIYEV